MYTFGKCKFTNIYRNYPYSFKGFVLPSKPIETKTSSQELLPWNTLNFGSLPIVQASIHHNQVPVSVAFGLET